MFDRVIENTCPPDVSVGIGQQRLASEDRGGPVELSAALVLAAFGDHQQIDGQVPAFGPPLRFRQQNPLAGLHHDECGRRIGTERGRHCLGHRVDGLAVLLPRVEQQPGFGVEQVVDRFDRAGLQQQRAGQTGRPCVGQQQLGTGALAGVVSQRLGKPENGPNRGVHRGRPVRVLGQGRQLGLQFAGSGQQPPSYGVPPLGRFCVPLLTQLDHLALEGLLGRVGGEVVLADPVLADDDGIVGRHGSEFLSGDGDVGGHDDQ